MINSNFKNIKSFFTSLFVCLIIFSIVLCFAVFPSKTKDNYVAKQNYSNIPYNTNQTVFMIKTSELPVCFLLKLLPKTKSFNISVIPLNSVKNSSMNFNDCESLDDFSDFLDTKVDYLLTLSNDALSQIINCASGIVAKTPYGVPSPVGSQLINDEREIAKLFSGSVINLLSMNSEPDAEFLEYQAYLMALVVNKFLADIDDQKYLLLKKISDLSLSYADYYNNKDIIKECASLYEASFYDGVWIDGLYYLL